MSRDLHSDIKTALSSGKFYWATLAKFEFNSTYHQTDAYTDLSYGGQTYLSTGLFLESGALVETNTINTGSIKIQMTTASTGILNDLLTNGHIDLPITLYYALLDSDSAYVNAPFEIFSGQVSGMQIKETSKKSVLTLTVANHWANLLATAGRTITNSSQQRFFDGDLCFNQRGQVQKKILWGKLMPPEGPRPRGPR